MRVLLVAFLLVACHQGESPKKSAPTDNSKNAAEATAEPPAKGAEPAKPTKPDSPDAYLRDIDRFCYAEKHADALHIETTARSLVVADWLGRNLETVRARDFLISLQSLSPADKAKRLRAEGAKAKLEDCPTAAAWEKLSAESSR